MRLPLCLLCLLVCAVPVRAQLPEVYSVAEGYYTLAPARHGLTRLKVQIPPEAEGKDWTLLDQQGHAWPFTHFKTTGEEQLIFDAPAGLPLRFLYGRIPDTLLLDPPAPPPNPDDYTWVRFTGHHTLERLQMASGLKHPLRLLGLWFIIAIFSFVALGTWYRDQIG